MQDFGAMTAFYSTCISLLYIWLVILTGFLHCLQVAGEVKPLVGKPGETVVHEAHEQNADVILCGSRGHGKLRRTFMGSVSDYIVHHSHVPVVVCRHKNHHHGHGHHHWMTSFRDKPLFFMNRLYTNIRLCYFHCMTWTLCVSEFSVNVFRSGFFLITTIVFEYAVYTISDEAINAI